MRNYSCSNWIWIFCVLYLSEESFLLSFHDACVCLGKNKTNQTNPVSLKWIPEQSLQQISIFTSCGSTNHLSCRDIIRSPAVMCKLLHRGIKLLLILYCFNGSLSFLADQLKRKCSKKTAGTTQAMASNPLLSFNASIHYATVLKYWLGILNPSKGK